MTEPLTDQQLTDRIAEATIKHGLDLDHTSADGDNPCKCGDWIDDWDAHWAELAVAVVQPELDRLRAEKARLTAFIERGFDTHMQFGVINPDGTTEMLPCADWCNACKLATAVSENARLRAELATVRDATLHEAARVLEETGRDDDAVNLLDLLANSPARPGCPDPIECDHEAEVGQLRAELEQTRQQIAAVLALTTSTYEELEQMDPGQYQQAVGYDGAVVDIQRMLRAAARPSA
jgi:hypothetical protein